MMRLPRFRYVAPRTLAEACRILAAEGPDAQVVAGGTDLLPNMKRRQQAPKIVVGLRNIAELAGHEVGSEARLGAGTTLSRLARDPALRQGWRALAMAAHSVATPHIRNMGTIGGNLCLDTRCNYYDQSFEWRRSIDFCMKKDGEVCWVAPGSPRCWAVSSTDCAPALLALDARVRVASPRGDRTIALDALYHDDGIKYLTIAKDEILAEVTIPRHSEWRSTYLKCRRRGSFDFPILSVAAAAKVADGVVEEARIVLGAVGSRPKVADVKWLAGRRLDDEGIAEAADEISKLAKPLDNTDLNLSWRKRVARDYVAAALRELRGDGPQRVPTGNVPLAVVS
jgi:4-hydroxybenzoyl-CoA reductase subunit beta